MPALIRRLVDHRLAPERPCILRQVLALHSRAIPADLHILAQGHCQIPDTTLNQALHPSVNVLHSEPRKVGRPVHTDIGLVLAWLHNRSSDICHIRLEGLGIDQVARLIHNRHDHLLGKDVHQLHAIAVLTAHQLLLILVVVRRGQQLAKDHLRNPSLVLRVLSHINRLAVVLDAERVSRARDLDRLHRVRRLTAAQAHNLVVGIDQ